MAKELGQVSSNGNYLNFSDWHMLNPDSSAYEEACAKLLYDPQNLTQADRYLIHAAVQAYGHFATHPAPTKDIVNQLRQVRATIKKVRKNARKST